MARVGGILALCLLCVSQGRQPALLGAPSADGGHVYQSVTEKVANLESRLSELEMENKQRLAEQTERYQKELEVRQQANIALASSNVQVTKDIEAATTKNAELRKATSIVQHDNEVLTADLAKLQSNLTTVLEFTSNSLKDLDIRQAKEISVLNELEETDSKRMFAEAHLQRLRDVARSPVNQQLALLQMRTSRRGSPSPKDLLKVLDAGFQDMNEEHREKVNALKTKYTELFHTEGERHEALLVEQKELNSTLKSLLKLGGRLEVALQFLEQQRKGLDERCRSIRMYAERLGIRQLPPLSATSGHMKKKSQEDVSSSSLRRAAEKLDSEGGANKAGMSSPYGADQLAGLLEESRPDSDSHMEAFDDPTQRHFRPKQLAMLEQTGPQSSSSLRAVERNQLEAAQTKAPQQRGHWLSWLARLALKPHPDAV